MNAEEADWRIFKFPLPVADEYTIRIHAGAQILSVGQQDNNMYLWALVNTVNPYVDYGIAIRGTGHSANTLDNRVKFLGSVHLYSGQVVFHVFGRGYAL